MNFKFLLLTVCLISITASAQTFKGVVTDHRGRPIPYATLFIEENKLGITADKNGAFQVHLPSGDYSCNVSCMGYSSITCKFQQNENNTEKHFSLPDRVYTMGSADRKKNDEAAHHIMLRTIGSASYYQRVIQSYAANMYTKGRGMLISIPEFLKVSKEIRNLSKNYQDRLLVLERMQRLDYRASDMYRVKTLAEKSSFPKQVEASIQPMTINIYDRMIFNKLSPLSREAFHYYKYILVCTIDDGENKIYKIQVIPRHNIAQLASGYIYVIDGLWCLSGFDLVVFDSHVVANIRMNCCEVMKRIWLPISFVNDLDIHDTGIKSQASVSYSIQYRKITLNNRFSMPAAADFHNVLDSLKSRHRYELLSPKDLIKITADNTAYDKDSVYWNHTRMVPLLSPESESYTALSGKQNSKSYEGQDWSDLRTWWNLVVKGNNFQSRDGKRWFTCYDFTSFLPEFNFVDGFWLGCKFALGTKLSNTASLSISPAGYYTTARHQWVGKCNISLNYTPRRSGKLSIEGGSLTDDYNLDSGESRIFNAVSALIFADNYIKFFNRRYLTLTNQIEPANGLLFTSSLSWERRTMIENNLKHSLLGQNADINHPLEDPSFFMPANRLLEATLSIDFTPSHYYRMIDNKKVFEPTNNPTLSLSYSRAFGLGGNSISPHFNKIQMGIQQSIQVGLFNHFIWSGEAGLFFNRKEIQFPDYHHFPTVMNTSTRRSFNYGFSLLDCYTYSTNNRWAMANMTWATPYFLFKYLPIFRLKSFDEAIHVRVLASHNIHPYLELGYSAGVEDLSRIGVFMGFDHNGYRSVGVSLSFPI